MARRDVVECPVCGSKLTGTRFTGFSCQKCKSHFSAKFVARMRRHHFKNLMDEHFVPKLPAPVKEETEVFLVPSNEVQEALEEAHESAKRSMQHLEDLLGVSEQVPEVVEAVASRVDLPGSSYAPSDQRIPVKARTMAKNARVKTIKRSAKVPVKRSVKKPRAAKAKKTRRR
jgi:hypothetical protein